MSRVAKVQKIETRNSRDISGHWARENSWPERLFVTLEINREDGAEACIVSRKLYTHTRAQSRRELRAPAAHQYFLFHFYCFRLEIEERKGALIFHPNIINQLRNFSINNSRVVFCLKYIGIYKKRRGN